MASGFDTNKCVIDKPCGTVALSQELLPRGIELVLARDATRPEATWLQNEHFADLLAVNLIESAFWLPEGHRFIRSTTVAELAVAFNASEGLVANASAPLAHDPLAQPSWTQLFREPAAVPTAALKGGTAALVVVACADDWANDGFHARVAANKARWLLPLLAHWRAKGLDVIHSPEGHHVDPACAPRTGEPVVNSTAAFDAARASLGVDTLVYAGYAANRELLFGHAGMQRFYSAKRYLYQHVPAYYFVEEATEGFETPESLAAGGWAKKAALAYRQPQVTSLGNVLRHAEVLAALGALSSGAGSDRAATSGAGAPGLVPAERAALVDMFNELGGAHWTFNAGTDVVGGGKAWRVDDAASDPCADGWFGIKCSSDGTHVLQLFPNTHKSGNPLVGVLPASIGNLTLLEHFYSSNDETPSSLMGAIPETIGNLKNLKCLYFSHNNITSLPKSVEGLTNLQVLLFRHNKVAQPMLDLSRLTKLLNVWFDTNELTGTLESLATLEHLTYLAAFGNHLHGGVPANLCGITCNAAGNANLSCPLPVPGCCDVTSCGDKARKPPHPPKVTMGDCFPQ